MCRVCHDCVALGLQCVIVAFPGQIHLRFNTYWFSQSCPSNAVICHSGVLLCDGIVGII